MSQTDPLVYHGIWTNFDLPPYQRVVLTLNSGQYLALITFVGALLAYTQTRLWIIWRYLLHRILRPIQLQDAEDPASLKNLSQSQAIRSLFTFTTPPSGGSMKTVSPWFGITSLFNVVLFIVFSTIVPYYLSGGAGTQVVRSMATEACAKYVKQDWNDYQNTDPAEKFFKDCWLNVSGTEPVCGRMARILSTRPALKIDRESDCPFPGNVCQSAVQPVRLSHTRLSPNDFGVNTKNKLLINHHVICAPLELEQFLYLNSRWGGNNRIWFGHPSDASQYTYHEYGILIETVNGPNRYSNKSSGAIIAATRGNLESYPLHVLPQGHRLRTKFSQNFHPDLQREDGDIFVIVFKAGRNKYEVPIDDPFYAAHRNAQGNTKMPYVPDFEATALGCVEQYQFCSENYPTDCTDWNKASNFSQLSVRDFNFASAGYEDIALDSTLLYPLLLQVGSMRRYLDTLFDTQFLLSSIVRRGGIQYIDPTEQWILEIKAWFEIAFLRMRIYWLRSLQSADSTAEDSQRSKLKDVGNICERILFLDYDSSNLNFIGLMATLLAIVVLWLVGFTGNLHTLLRSLGLRNRKPRLTDIALGNVDNLTQE